METLNPVNTKWALDAAHSELSFKVRHLMISNVKGEFRKFEATIQGSDFKTAPIYAEIDAASIFTNDEKRDAHLRAADFFDVENYKHITFRSKSLQESGEGMYTLTGVLSLKGVSKEIELAVEFGGTNTDPWGNQKAAFAVSGKINRKDWGLNWNAALETGGVLVGEEVRIEAELQFALQPEA